MLSFIRIVCWIVFAQFDNGYFAESTVWQYFADIEGLVIWSILYDCIPINRKFCARLQLYLHFSKCKYIIFDVSSCFQCHTVNVYNSKMQANKNFYLRLKQVRFEILLLPLHFGNGCLFVVERSCLILWLNLVSQLCFWILNDLRLFPTKNITEEKQRPFIDLVDHILEVKRANPAADNAALEAQINPMVYKLYALTYDEVLTTDPSPQSLNNNTKMNNNDMNTLVTKRQLQMLSKGTLR